MTREIYLITFLCFFIGLVSPVNAQQSKADEYISIIKTNVYKDYKGMFRKGGGALKSLNYGDWEGYIPIVIWEDSNPRNFKSENHLHSHDPHHQLQ